MTDPQLFTIIGSVLGVGITLAALIVGLIAWVRSDVRRLDSDFRSGQARLEERQINQGERLARLEGKIDRLDPRPPYEPTPAPAGD